MKLVLIALGIVSGAVLSVGGAIAAPSSFQLVFDGKHSAASFDTPSGLQHEGPFTTSSPFCPSGTAKDVASLGADVATRVFTCTSGGQFTARVGPLLSEHGGSGTWQIVDGTGAVANLRGMGTWRSVRSSSDDFFDPAKITFRTTWDGVAAMDAVPPAISLVRASVQKLNKPAGTYSVNLRLSIADGQGDTVSYTISLADARKSMGLASKSGRASTRTVALALRVKPAKGVRALRLKVDATDAVGNAASFVRSIRIV